MQPTRLPSLDSISRSPLSARPLLAKPRAWGAALALTFLAAGVQGQESQESTSEAEVVETVPIESITDVPELQRLIEVSRNYDGARQHIEVITSHFPNRLTGSSQLKLAQGWAVMTFEDWGIPAQLEQWGEVEVGFDRGPKSGRVLSPEPRELTFITPCWSPGTLGAVKGPALREPETFEELEERSEEFVGAWVLRNSKVSRSARRKFDAFFGELGVAGTVRPGSRDGRLVTSGSWNIEWDELPTLVKVSVLYEQYEELSKQVDAAAEGDGEPVVLEFNIENQFLHGPLPQHNVVAEITGSEWPDEYVIVQGHIDAWDGAQGACDNGTGVATTLEAARMIMFADITPKRSIRFVLYSGEEQGLYGSQGYVDQHVDELENISVVFNHDNGTNFLRGIAVTEAMMEDFEEVFAPIQRLDPSRPFEISQIPGLRPGPSDHSPFITAGVPAFHWDQAKDGYRRLHHTQHDTLAEVNHEDQRHSALLIAMAAVGFANKASRVDRSYMREPDPRRMGVYLGGEQGTFVQQVVADSHAEKAGWQSGDEILSVDGQQVATRREISSALQEGGPKKVIEVRRGEEVIETVLDYSDDPLEEERKAWRKRREAEAQSKSEGEAAAEEAPVKEDGDK